MVVEELAAVIRVKLEHREGQAGEDTAEGISDDKPALAEDGGDLAPAGDDVPSSCPQAAHHRCTTSGYSRHALRLILVLAYTIPSVPF